MTIEIYHAELQDIPWLTEQLEEFSKFSMYEKKQLFPEDEAYGLEFLTNLINKQVCSWPRN